jgi:predicted 3-demethylubiquinone-9 3-methyltransferase (glyoxalase superfamily)
LKVFPAYNILQIFHFENIGYFCNVYFIKALKLNMKIQKITPFLWFEQDAETAAQVYTSIFQNGSLGKVARQGEKVFTCNFSINDQNFVALNGGPMFKLNPSISFYTICESDTEIEFAWQKLTDGGKILMPLNKYPWSENYGYKTDLVLIGN